MNRTTRTLIISAAMTGLAAGSALTMTGCSSGNAGQSSGQNSQYQDYLNKHDCKGQNSCKGQGGCKTSDMGCKGKNGCKGESWFGGSINPASDTTATSS